MIAAYTIRDAIKPDAMTTPQMIAAFISFILLLPK